MLKILDKQKHFQEYGLFQKGKNCWRTERADHAAIIVDCANYYRDLHESLSKARHSIFITGWDIDSRVRLLRRDDDSTTPETLYDLLTQKARENPDLQIYLNRWKYALFMAASREPMSAYRWHGAGLPNIHFCHDNLTPAGGCHHQKIVVVDDEVAFTGGMDVAFGRWDHRAHDPDDGRRIDPGGVYNPTAHVGFPPYHDIMTVMSGPAARALAELSRERWRRAAGYDAVEMRPASVTGLPHCWPDTDPPDFEDIDVAICRTFPAYANVEPAYEIEQMYLDEIAAAENFIYIENQYLTRLPIAQAIRRRMMEKPDLRVLLVSSYDPQGYFEKVTMWVGRLKFRAIVASGGMQDRVTLAYPISRGHKGSKAIRIHSKIMIVDDRFFHIGSANLNSRSMRLDTECDVVYQAVTLAQRAKLADVRNDLIHEHTGIEKDVIQTAIDRHDNPARFLDIVKGSSRSLMKIHDRHFFKTRPVEAPLSLGDPEKGLLPEMPLPKVEEPMRIRYFPKKKIVALAALFVITALLVYVHTSGMLDDVGTRAGLAETLENIRGQPGSLFTAIGIYVAAATLFVPITLLTGVTAVIFGYVDGLLISLIGAMISAAIGYQAGRLIGGDTFNIFAGSVMERLRSYAQSSNVVGLTFLRMIPIAPYAVMNMALGIVKVPFTIFMTGTLFGLLPGKIVAIFIASSLADLWLNPDPQKILMAGAGIVVWFLLVWITHRLYSQWQEKNKAAA